MTGFDTDTTAMFDEQYRFIDKTAIPITTCNILVASEGTPLYERLEREGRLVDGGGKATARDQYFDTNIIPKLMSKQTLVSGHRSLIWRLYRADAFGKRFSRLMRLLPKKRPAPHMPFIRVVIRAGKLLRPANAVRYARSLTRLFGFYLRPRYWRLGWTFLGWLLRRPSYLEVIGVHMAIFAQFTAVHRAQGFPEDREPEITGLDQPQPPELRAEPSGPSSTDDHLARHAG
jgi:hypothetical protein